MAELQTGSIAFDIAEREAQVIGTGPRIEALPDSEVDPACWDMVNEMRAAIGLPPATSLPEFTRLMAKHPALFRCQMDMGTALFQGLLPARERELAVLRIGWLCRAPYEWGEHVAIGQRYGVSGEEIERVTRGSSAAGWSEHEKAILRGVEELLADQAVSEATYTTLAATWSEPQLIEYLMMVGQYVTTAFIQNSLRVRMGEGNSGLSRR